MISQEKWMILAPVQKLPKNVGDLGKLIVAKGYKRLPKVQKIANFGHTVSFTQPHYQMHLTHSLACIFTHSNEFILYSHFLIGTHLSLSFSQTHRSVTYKQCDQMLK